MAQAALSITETDSDGIKIIALDGDLDAHTVPALKASLDKNIASGKVKILLDATKLSYISSAGIGTLNAALATIKGKGGKLSIGGAGKTVYDTLEVMYFTKKVDVFPSLKDALANFNL
jgi:anti-anti-sigma factor